MVTITGLEKERIGEDLPDRVMGWEGGFYTTTVAFSYDQIVELRIRGYGIQELRQGAWDGKKIRVEAGLFMRIEEAMVTWAAGWAIPRKKPMELPRIIPTIVLDPRDNMEIGTNMVEDKRTTESTMPEDKETPRAAMEEKKVEAKPEKNQSTIRTKGRKAAEFKGYSIAIHRIKGIIVPPEEIEWMRRDKEGEIIRGMGWGFVGYDEWIIASSNEKKIGPWNKINQRARRFIRIAFVQTYQYL